jgi:VWFA-related protein
MRLQMAALVLALVASPQFVLAQQSTSTHTPPQILGPDTPGQPPDSGIRLRAKSRLVIVDVVVTDSNRNPVHGLKREDFQLTENSAPQQISGFEEITGANLPARSSEPLAPLPPHVYTNFQPNPPGPAVNLLLLDALNTPLQAQSYVRQQMIKYLKTMQPGTRVAIFTLASRLRILQGFTSDSSVLLSALNSKGALPQTSALLDNSFEPTLSDQLGPLGQMPALSSLQQFEADRADTRIQFRARYTVDALASIAAYLSGIPGRKNLIWFSGAFPEYLSPDFSRTALSTSAAISDDIRRVTDSLTLGQIAIYPVDARGLMPSPLFSAENSGSQYVGPAGSQRFNEDSSRFLQLTAAEHATMDEIANETGGHAFYNTNGLQQALAKAIEMGSSYYQLSYTPANSNGNGQFRKVKVSLRQAGYTLAYRRGYFADDPDSARQHARIAAQPMQATMQRGAPSSSQILFKLRLLPVDELSNAEQSAASVTPTTNAMTVKEPKRKYALDFAISAEDVSLSATPDGVRHGTVEFEAIAYDADGNVLNGIRGAMVNNLTPATFQRVSVSGIPLRQTIDLPVGAVFLRVGVHDPATGKVGSLEIPLRIISSQQPHAN